MIAEISLCGFYLLTGAACLLCFYRGFMPRLDIKGLTDEDLALRYRKGCLVSVLAIYTAAYWLPWPWQI